MLVLSFVNCDFIDLRWDTEPALSTTYGYCPCHTSSRWKHNRCIIIVLFGGYNAQIYVRESLCYYLSMYLTLGNVLSKSNEEHLHTQYIIVQGYWCDLCYE